MPTVTVDQFKAVCTKLLRAVGAADDEVVVLTEALLFSSLRGHDDYGSGHLPIYVRTYHSGMPYGPVNKGGTPTIVRETAATVTIDGNWCLGQKVALQAAHMAVKKAQDTGIAAATIFRNTHTGALGYYASKMVEHDMIGLMFTGAGAVSPPSGGVERILGTNPMSIGIPAKDEYPIIIDMATSSTTWTWLLPRLALGEPLAVGYVLDDEGEPTTDPNQFSGRPRPGEAAHGAMANLGGGHKGYGVQLAVEMLGGILPALITSNEVQDTMAREGRLHTPALIIAINIGLFQDVDAFKAKVDERIRQIRASKRKKGVAAIYLPGERGFRTREKRLKEGIPISDDCWNDIVTLSDELKVDLARVLSDARAG